MSLVRQTTEKRTVKASAGRLSKAERREQLLGVAQNIIREEGADRLTLAYLAAQAGVTKPISYEHFGTRAGLLLALYKKLDEVQTNMLREALSSVQGDVAETIDVLSRAYMHCAADSNGEWHLVAAALSGNEGVGPVHQELLDNYVALFVSAMVPFTSLDTDELKRRCIGLVGAGEALSLQMVNGYCTEKEAAQTFAALISGGIA
ncbi:TetR/AcrR family transcriptional regulator [Thalassospira sp.]|uniref:TetR/AcrR family transcriptional regulator n=1 Tax=Thalassospira sp. TaxID=1912094 RepID=UPI003AA99D3F